jgi:UDP-glucose 4-epimerase
MGRVVLVTGGSGFLGSSLISALLERGDHVVAISHNNNTFDERCTVVQGDLSRIHLLNDIPFFDYYACFHLAGSSSVPYSWADPVDDFNKGIPGTVGLLRFLAQHYPNCRLVVSSSAAVYGNPVVLPINEQATISPISPYGIHKAAIELLCEHYSSLFDIPIKIMRIFSAYGRGLRKQLLWDTVNKLENAVLVGQSSIHLSGTGFESRDFIHMSDVARAAILLADASLPSNFNIINVASGNEVQICKVVNLLCNLWGHDVTPVFSGESRPGDPCRWVADISQLSSLGFSPCMDIKAGIQDYVAWARGVLSAR